MKYLKYFEENSEPEVGDYVICQDKFYSQKIEFENYLKNNVGKIIKKTSDLYKVAFDNEPSLEILEYAFIQKNNAIISYLMELNFDIKTFQNKYSNVVGFNINEIVEFAKTKEDLEAKIAAKKYNL